MTGRYQCPVCHCRLLESKPYSKWPPQQGVELSPPYEKELGTPSYEVCPRCGFEFGNDDNPGTGTPASFEAYRDDWEARGRPWLSERAKLQFEASCPS